MRPYRPLKPSGRSVNSPSWWYYLLVIVLWLCMLGFIALVAVEWAAGCGETYTDANGVQHQNECVFIPQPTVTKE